MRPEEDPESLVGIEHISKTLTDTERLWTERELFAVFCALENYLGISRAAKVVVITKQLHI